MTVLMFTNSVSDDENRGFGFNELKQAFEQLNCRVIVIGFSDKDLIAQINQTFLSQRIDFALAFNWIYSNVCKLISNTGNNVLNDLNIPFVTYLWDAICMPTNPAIRTGGINHLLAACVSEEEPAQIKILAPHVKQAFFCPLGGSEPANKGGG